LHFTTREAKERKRLEKGFGNEKHEEGEDFGAKVKLRLGLLKLEVRGLVFKHNLFLLILISA